MDGLVVGVCSKLILSILVVQVCYVIVADARSLEVLPCEEDACLCQIYQGDYVRLLLHEFVLRELVIRDQVAKLDLEFFDLFAFTTRAVQMDLIVIVGLQDLIHPHV